MSKDTSPPPKRTAAAIARQPIFDEGRRLWGYDLFCVGEGASCSSDQAAMEIAASAYMTLQRILVKQGQKIVINFNEMAIVDNMPYALPPEQAVVEVDEQLFLRPDILQGLEKIKSDGYLIAVRGFTANSKFDALYELADIVGISVAGRDEPAIASLVAAVRTENTRLFARRVDDAAQFDLCREKGIALFEGAFFKQPDTITVHKMTSNKASRLQLLQRMEDPDPDIDDLAQTIQTDASISFRLLSYLNSAAYGFSQKINSIQHAIRLLGWNKLKNWLRVVLLNEMSESADAEHLLQLAAQRGKFLERVAMDNDFWGFDPESLHLLGLFSLLDTMLQIPMSEIVSFLPIDEKLKGALQKSPNNEYLPLLELAQFIEEARWEEANALIQRLNLNRDKIMAAFNEAVGWADQLLGAGAEAAT